MLSFDDLIVNFANWIWDIPLVLLISGSGLFFLVYSRFLPFRHLHAALRILVSHRSQPKEPGQLSHFHALTLALAATVGMGNVAGVAVAISMGGPGVVFWMWISAVLGMATRYFTCSLAVMFRGKDSSGEIQGGPMYVITEGLGKKFKPLAVFFCVAGIFGCLPIFNSNQLCEAVGEMALSQAGWNYNWLTRTIVGSVFAILTGTVVVGGLQRISNLAGFLVPIMVVVYFVSVVAILVRFFERLPYVVSLIFVDAFNPSYCDENALFGGALGALIVLGAQRAAFSNEAGIGTASMAHGAAKTSEPVHEGLVAMLGPVIDTLLVCTLTAAAILVTGVWDTDSLGGITLTANAFEKAFPNCGKTILLLCVLSFGISSLFSYSYFGTKCFCFLFGRNKQHLFSYFYVVSVLLGAVFSIDLIVSFVDIMFALMAIPTIVSSVALAPAVLRETRRYFDLPSSA